MDPEDILSDSLQCLYNVAPVAHSSAGSLFTFITNSQQTITVRTPDTHHTNWSLHASSIWVSSLYLADHLDHLGLDEHPQPVRVLELGAGAGLPSILIAKTYGNALVTASDYPDDQLIRTLSDNIEQNGVSSRCRVVAHAWGSDTSALCIPCHAGILDRFEVVFAADTLWNPELHAAFIETLQRVLSKTTTSRVHLVAGFHTGRYTLQSFLSAVQKAGFELVAVIEKRVGGNAERPFSVATAETEDEQERRRWVLWISLKWR